MQTLAESPLAEPFSREEASLQLHLEAASIAQIENGLNAISTRLLLKLALL